MKPTHTLISIDPGETTGLAFFADGRLTHTTVYRSSEKLLEALRSFTPTDVVIERPPVGQTGTSYRSHMDTICPQLREMYPKAHWILPGQWKQGRRAFDRHLFDTQHECDAANLGSYAYLYVIGKETLTKGRIND